MHVKSGAMGIGLAIWLAVGASWGASAVQWQPSLERAQVLAAHTNRLVLVHFWGDGCPPCAWMEQAVFTRTDVAGAIDRGFVAVKLNTAQYPQLAGQYGVKGIPADVIITPQGQLVAAYEGKAPPAEFIGRLDQVAQRYFGPANPNALASNAPVNQMHGYLQGMEANTPGMDPRASTPHAYGAGPQPNGMAYNGPPAPQQTASAPPSMNAPVAPRYTDQYPTGPDPYGAYAPNQAMPPSASGNPYPADSQMPPANAMAQPSAAPFQQPLPRQEPAGVPAGNPPVALDGYCAVSLERTMRLDQQPKWVPGDPRWGLRHEGRTYLFAGPEEQQAFFQNPDFYAPIQSGQDVVALIEQGQRTLGVRDFGARWRDRVYLFSNKANYDKFQTNPAVYEAEVLRLVQSAAAPPQSPGQNVGAMPNPGYGYR